MPNKRETHLSKLLIFSEVDVEADAYAVGLNNPLTPSEVLN